MDLLKLAIRYYVKVTGNTCIEFYKDIESVVKEKLDDQTGDDWLRHKLIEQVINNGFSLKEIEENYDAMLKYFGTKYESDVQEYSASTAWGKEVFKTLEQNIENLDDFVFWDINCLSDSLFSPNKLNFKNVYMSHYREQVISTVSAKKGGTLFAFDFMHDFDLTKVPEDLKAVIENDKPLVLLCCIPIRKGGLQNDISNRMYENGFTVQSEDVYYQYLYQMCAFVNKFNLTNCYIGIFGDTNLYTDKNNVAFYQYFRKYFNFKTGFCFSLKDFNSTLLNINSMHFSLWKTEETTAQTILLNKKRLVSKTKIESGEDILFETNRDSILEWLEPKDVLFYVQAPMMTNYATFKQGEKFDKHAVHSAKVAKNYLGTISITDSMQDISKVALYSVAPSTKNYVSITEENFERCVASFAFARLVMSTWNNNSAKISAPNTEVEGYKEWVKNAILMMFFDDKSMFSNLRNIEWEGAKNYTVENKMFFVAKDFIEMTTHDSLIKQQVQSEGNNAFIIQQINEAKAYWVDETRNLYEFCLDFVQRTMDMRKGKHYIEDTDSWNAGFAQLKSVFGKEDVMFKSNFDRLYIRYTDYLRQSISKFGFLQDK